MSKSELLFLAVLIILPVQLNKFFFFDFSYVLGLPIDYRAISVYASDLVIIAYLIFFTLENIKNHRKPSFPKHFLLIIASLNLYLFINSLFFSTSQIISLWFTLKIFLFSAMAIASSVSLTRPNIKKHLAKIIALSLLWQSLVIIFQFLAQRSLGLWFLGERSFDAGTVNIAHTQISAIEFLRPYGTFPHPNIAAAFFLIYLIILLAEKREKSKFFLSASSIFAILITNSQAALLAGAAAVISTTAKFQKLLFLALGIFLTITILFKYLSESQVASIAERLTLAQKALEISSQNPAFGIGSLNFINELSKYDLTSIGQIRLLQPVHNVFLLILAENGIIGLLLFLGFLIYVVKNINSRPKLALFIAILVFASVDHFIWTLQQGQLLFWLVVAYILSRQPRSTRVNT